MGDNPSVVAGKLDLIRMADSQFFTGNRVRVSQNFFWAKGAVGTISEPPDAWAASPNVPVLGKFRFGDQSTIKRC